MSSITDVITGRVRLTFSTAFSSTAYAVLATAERHTTAQADNNDKLHCTVRNGSRTTTTVDIEFWDGSDAADPVDPAAVFVSIFGDQ